MDKPGDDMAALIAESNTFFNKINSENAIKGKPVDNLSGILHKTRIKNLRDMALFRDIKGASHYKKAELIEKLEPQILDPKRMKEFLMFTDPELLTFFIGAMQTAVYEPEYCTPDLYMELCLLGYIGMFAAGDNRFTFVVPFEIRNLAEATLTETFGVFRKQVLIVDRIARIAVHLYGVVTLKEIQMLVNHYFPGEVTFDLIKPILDGLAPRRWQYEINEKYILNPFFFEEQEEGCEEEQEFYYAEAERHLRYMPDKRNFLKYESSAYHENTEEISQLEDYMAAVGCTDAVSTCLASDVADLCRSGGSFPDIMEALCGELEQYNPDIDPDELASYVARVNNTTRMWLNNGFTPDELVDQKRPPLSVINGDASCKTGAAPTGKRPRLYLLKNDQE